ncbi:tyrosine--tRNA ligase [Sphingobacterium psychroaquaticum]|uniref:Tyrosine--tRNA ligase n=1 Tax=Sphingobacterium psychroaquaticum TaxID=561061 RepID=A0A1X7JSD2_9SPHI|nr:tyrosine--tRNA ligase [Sphingobacterium psychroaquaticum]SMG30973.1 tyrosyl-tRNA synthetase [Sphingobacterium psychroaquaticum]
MNALERLQENVEIMLPQQGLELKLKENRPLTIKLGFDPTAPDLHLGHAVVLKKLKQFQDLGHQVVILVGSFTARIGDPTGKNKSRKPLNTEEVTYNAETYINQLSKVIDVAQAKIVFNSDWLDTLSFSDVIQLLSKVTVAQLMHRHDFNKRFTENTPIAMHELVYPVLQGYDSVQINADIEMGGTDQLFNCTMGRQLQEVMGVDGQVVMCMPLLKGLDGKEKMSKSLNNIIGLTDEPNDMYGKMMSVPDTLLEEYLDLTTDFSEAEKQGIKQQLTDGVNPMLVKQMIAENIIKQYHSLDAATTAADFFRTQFQNKQFESKSFLSTAWRDLTVNATAIALVDLCVQLKPSLSKSAIRRLIQEGAVQLDGVKMGDADFLIPVGKEVRVKMGKRDFFELVG